MGTAWLCTEVPPGPRVLPEAPDSLPGQRGCLAERSGTGDGPELCLGRSGRDPRALRRTYQKALQVEKPAPRKGRLTARPSGKFWIPIPMAKFLKDQEDP